MRVEVSEGEAYKIDLLSVFKRGGTKTDDFIMINSIINIFEELGLQTLIRKLKEIKCTIIGMIYENEPTLRNGFLKRELESLARKFDVCI